MPLSLAGNLFVFIVILAGPLVGLVLTWLAQRTGGAVIAITMAASLVFGVVNHFVLFSPDHISHVEPSVAAALRLNCGATGSDRSAGGRAGGSLRP